MTGLVLGCIGAYFVLLLGIAWFTSRRATADSYFLGNRASPWIAVAFGLVGDSLSGVTFISVPGQVAQTQFTYLQIVLGYVLGYVVIAEVLLPLYYRLRLTSIYAYLDQRFGPASQKTGSLFFLLSRTTGAAARLYLAAQVIQPFVFDAWGVPFWLSVAGVIALILAYTVKGGIRTLVWTDTLQSGFLLLGLLLSLGAIASQLQLDGAGLATLLRDSPHTRVFEWDWRSPRFFWKQFLSGACIAIVMTGLDQNMMQKNLSCRSLRDARTNLYAFTGVLVLVNLLILTLGALLLEFASARGIAVPAQTDRLFPLLALQHLGTLAAVAFVIGLTAATFSSADSVLTTLTTSFCLDFLRLDRRTDLDDRARTRIRHAVHAGFAVVLLLVILGFKALNSTAVINAVFTLASYSYGPLLGLFAFGLATRWQIHDRAVPLVAVAAPLVCLVLDRNSTAWFGGYQFGFELLLVNGAVTFAGLLLLIRRPSPR